MSILHRPYINSVIFLVGAEPLDKNDLSLIIDGNHQPIIISFNIKDNAVFADNACAPISFLDLSRRIPDCLLSFVKPCIQSCFDGFVVFASPQRFRKIIQGSTCNDSHSGVPYITSPWYSCIQTGHKSIFWQGESQMTET